MESSSELVALILAGGSGSRFWPLSRRARPKQLLSLRGSGSLLQQTLERLAPLVSPARAWVCTTRSLKPAIEQQLENLDGKRILGEPAPRNTAPAIAWAIRNMPKETREHPVVILPSDHWIADTEAFRRVLAIASEAVATGAADVVALGVRPRYAATGYGYLELGQEVDETASLVPVQRFVEKPDLATAERFVAAKTYLWNAGIFVFCGSTLLRLMERHQPQLASRLDAVLAATDAAQEQSLYASLPDISIDYAVMEHLTDLLTVPLDCGWTDLGSWEALYELLDADSEGNRSRGSTVTIDAQRNLLFADQGTIAVVGAQDLVVIRTDDSVLVVPRSRSQEVRKLVTLLRERGLDNLL